MKSLALVLDKCLSGDSASVHAAFAQLRTVVREHPYSDNIEEAIYLTALGQSALAASEQSLSIRKGSLEFLEYLGDGYAPMREGTPTALLEPRWDFDREVANSGERPAEKRVESVLKVSQHDPT